MSKLVAGEEVPRVLLLAGGPGNGKTDAVEGCIQFFDSEMKAGGALVKAFASKYNVKDGELPPRKAVVDLSSVGVALPEYLKVSISLVQDATEDDASQNETNDPPTQNAHLSFWIGCDYQKQGFGKAGVMLAIEHIKGLANHLKLKQIQTTAWAHNTASRRILAQMRFIEGPVIKGDGVEQEICYTLALD